jgi:FkbM family methyltransferase
VQLQDPTLAVQHHQVFSHFHPFSGEVPAFNQVDFLGARIRQEFVASLSVSPRAQFVTTGYPPIDEEYTEWIDLLESVVAAKKRYTMIELGAGFGRWVVRASRAVQQFDGSLPCSLIAVEAEPTVYQWMHLHFRDNGVDPNRHSIVHGAVTESDQDILFYIGGPRGGPYDRNLNDWYGQFLTQDYDIHSASEIDGYYQGQEILRHESGWRSIRVPAVRLTNLLRDQDLVDLVDMDIEGQELPVIRATILALNAKVKRLHIGTHGKEIESELRQLLSTNGWECRFDYSLFSTSETPWGKVRFENGSQSWLNPRLA